MCNSDKTTLSKTALCPADRQEEEEEEEEEEGHQCSCLPIRLVEDDLIKGVSPLGLDSQQCYQVPSDMIYNLHNRNGSREIIRYRIQT